MVARIVCCRRASFGPLCGIFSDSQDAEEALEVCLTARRPARAQRGSPSNLRRISPTVRLSSERANSSLTAAARSTNSFTAADWEISSTDRARVFGSASGKTANSFSRPRCKRSRLVTNIFACGRAEISFETIGIALMRCSKLSKMSNMCLPLA